MEITLKNVKVANFMSHETTCYQATIYVDGNKAGTVENDGQGGESNVQLDEKYIKLETHKFPTVCSCALRPNCDICKGTGTWYRSIDNYCDNLLYEMEHVKERNKLIAKYTKQGYNYMFEFMTGYFAVASDSEESARATMKEVHPKKTIISIIKLTPSMSFDDIEKEKRLKNTMNKYRKQGFKFMAITTNSYIGSKRSTEVEVRESIAKAYPNQIIKSIITL